MNETVTVTVAPGQTVRQTFKWSSADGAEHTSLHTSTEGETVAIPAPMVAALRETGAIL